jgi:pyrimidine deaminase RibD-like protein
MMRHALQQAQPQRGRAGMSPAIGRTVPLNPGLAVVRTAARPRYGGRSAEAIAWRRPAPRAPFRQRLAQWRARHWRHAVLAWFVLSLIIVGVAAEPAAAFPRAQLRSVPAARTFLRVAGALTVAGAPVLLVALP